MTQPVLTTRDLTKRYGDFTALDSVSLTLEDGDIYGLVGRNGAGKTTFFKCVMGLAKPTAGCITVGATTSNLSRARRQVGFMIDSRFFPYLNPAENLTYYCQVKGIAPVKGEVNRLLDIVGLAHVKKPFKAFSMGMKQRLGIAGALLGSPAIVILDEPINGLDPQGIIEMRSVIQTAHAESGATFIISSHILSELDLVASRFGFIDHGRLLKEITHNDLHEHTRQSLTLEVDDGARAQALLAGMGVAVERDGNRLTCTTHLDQSADIARAIVRHDLDLIDLHRQATTLEEFFVSLVGGTNA